VKNADQIIALKNGRVDAQGTHEELLERSDWYRETWDRQRMQKELEDL
jgi:ATP-binding cassette subfamily B protein